VSIEVDSLHHKIIINGKTSGKFGSGPGEFHYPSNAVVLDDRAYVCDSWNHRVQVFKLPEWKFDFEFGEFFCPKWIEMVEDRGRPLLLVVDTNNARVCFHEPNGRRYAVFSFESHTYPVKARLVDCETVEIIFEDEHTESFDIANIIRCSDWGHRLDKPVCLVRDDRGFIYVSDFGRRTVEMYDTSGSFVGEVLGPDVLKLPGKMVMNGDDLIITDRPANAVFIYDTVKETHRRWDYPFNAPGFVGRDARGNIWVGSYTCEPNPKGATFPVFTRDYEFLRTVTFRETKQPTCVGFAADRVLIGDQHARNVFIFSEDGVFNKTLRDQPYDAPVWSVRFDDAGHIYVGVGPVVDLLWLSELKRLYYIDFDTSSVRYSGERAFSSRRR
jgi:sugar lactone lactonase YvrE